MEKPAEMVEKVAAQLGVTAEYLWPKVAQVHMLESLVAVVLSLGVLALGLWKFPGNLKRLVELSRRTDTVPPDFVIPILSVIVFGLMVLFGSRAVVSGWSAWIPGIVNPEGSLILRALEGLGLQR